jgi:hypothetical protein
MDISALDSSLPYPIPTTNDGAYEPKAEEGAMPQMVKPTCGSNRQLVSWD